MAERRHGGRRGDARGGGRGDLPNEEAARQRDLRDIENDDLRQQVRDLQCDIENGDLRQQVRDLQRDIENGDLRQQVRDLQRRLARLEKCRGKSNPMRSIAPERRSMDDPLFNDVFTSYDVDEPSKNRNSNIFSMPVYDTPVYDEDIFYELPEPPKNSNNNILAMPVHDKPVYDEDILSMPVYDKPVYDEDILSMPVVYDKLVYDEDILLMSKSPPPSMKFDYTAEDEGVINEEFGEAEGGNRLLGDQIEETPAIELCIVTTLARSIPPALEEALRRIKVIQELELCHYDLNLAAIVALNSQKVTAKWNPEEAHMPDLEEAPVFYPSKEKFEDTLKYISSIRAQEEIYGICPLKETDIWEKSKFATRVQRIDKLQNRNAMRKILQLEKF
ncbi:hypothetical protein SASPL_102056 [Salvia splendens]|uniref:JmjN domain-containing protein n=1 Tax=Salvia splendens TaxID=180675 RepID=A0A8X8YQH9_SALSN|nr:hypothetical protein SASPL_102056 [Salvia splendens]